VKRIRDVAGRSALVTAALAVVLCGCSALSPSTISTPYPAADGVNLDLPGSSVKLRDFIVIGPKKGAPAVVLGSVVNEGASEAKISLQADLGATTQPTETVVTVGPNTSVQVGPDEKFQMEIPQLPVLPGATTTLSATTTTGGKAEIIVPVLPPELEYASVTPAPTTEQPTPSSSATGKRTASETEQPTAAPNPTES